MVKAPSSISPRERGRSCEKAICDFPGTWGAKASGPAEGALKLRRNRDLRQSLRRAVRGSCVPRLALIHAETRRNGEARKRRRRRRGTGAGNCPLLRAGVDLGGAIHRNEANSHAADGAKEYGHHLGGRRSRGERAP